MKNLILASLLLIFPNFTFAQTLAQPETKTVAQTETKTVAQPEDVKVKIKVGKYIRSYLIHFPPNYQPSKKYPMIVAFHGVGGTDNQFDQVSDLQKSTDRAGFIVVYPNGVNRSWKIDNIEVIHPLVDDIGFIDQMLQKMLADYPINSKRIFALGISNGGLFTFKLACLSTNKFAGIGVVAMNMTKYFADHCKLNRPLSVIHFMGSHDPIIPFDGGYMQPLPYSFFEYMHSTQKTAEFWRQLNSCSDKLEVSEIDKIKTDNTKITMELAPTCKNKSRVETYYVEGGGHTWPGGHQYLPDTYIGEVSEEINASEKMVQFFQKTPSL